MLKPNHKNLSCEFAEQIISFLYGETIGAEKRKFELHLENCEICPAELASFSDVRVAFAELKDEFSLMKTPKIEIPYEDSRQNVEVSSVETSWLDGIRAIFGNISAWQTATAALAVLIVLAFFSIFLLKGNNNELAAETNKNSPKPVAKKSVSNSVVKPEKSPEEVKVQDEKIKENQPDVAKISNDEPKEKSVVKIDERPRTEPKNNNVNKQTQPKNNNLKNANQNKRNDLPRLNDEVYPEDDSLRLADIFEEIDSTED